MATTRYRHTGYGSRVGNSFKGVIGGLIAIIAAFALIWWNEGNSVRDIKLVAEGRKNTVAVQSNLVDASNDGKLIHLSATAETSDTLVESQYGFSTNAIKFRRVVEMYQYKENKKSEKLDNSTYVDTYTYDEVWATTIIDSDEFEESWRRNPKEFNNEPEEIFANEVGLGAFQMSESLMEKMGGYESFPISAELYQDSSANAALVHKGMLYYGYDTKYPEIGDERIYFEAVYPQKVSVIAKQVGASFSPFYVKKAKKNIEMITLGTASPEEMYLVQEQSNKISRWMFRGLGLLLMAVGFSLVLKPLSVIGGGLPLIGNVLEEGAAALIGIVAFLVAIALTFITIALAWVFYRPVLGIVLLCVGIGSLFITKKFAEPPAVKENLVK